MTGVQTCALPIFVVRGPVASGVARVVASDTEAVVVTQKETVRVALASPLTQVGANKWSAPITPPEGEVVSARTAEAAATLTVVLAGGCTCGKPWLKRGTSAELLAGTVTPTTVPV